MAQTKKSQLLQIIAWTPCFDAISYTYGKSIDKVLGRVWRYAQMNGTCQASRDTIALDVGLSEKTVERALALLVKDGYIRDHSKGLRNRPHSYTVIESAIIALDKKVKKEKKDLPQAVPFDDRDEETPPTEKKVNAKRVAKMKDK